MISERLNKFCDFNEMVITGTVFPHKEIHKQTWVSLDRRTKNQIDHTLVNRKFSTSVLDTKAMRSAGVASNNYLVQSTIRLKPKSMRGHLCQYSVSNSVMKIKFFANKIQPTTEQTELNLGSQNRN